MGRAENLEASIQKLIEAGRKLRKERDTAFKEVGQAHKKLDETKETIKGLRLNIEQIKKNDRNYQGFENKKKEIIRHIQTIISKLD